MYLIAAMALAFGLVLLLLGLRGRAIDDHPVCPACRYDLFGLQSPIQCPECGAGLGRFRPVRIGNRRQLTVLILSSLLPIAASLGLMIIALKGWTWESVKPFRFLLSELSDGSPGVRTQAAYELMNRLGKGRLSQSQVSVAVQQILKNQADRSVEWTHPCGAFVLAARSQKLVSDGQMLRFCEQAVTLGTETLPPMVRGKRLPLILTVQGEHCATFPTYQLEVQIEDASIDGHPLRWRTGSVVTVAPCLGAPYPLDPGIAVLDVDPGSYTLRIHWRIKVIEPGSQPTLGWSAETETPLLVSEAPLAK